MTIRSSTPGSARNRTTLASRSSACAPGSAPARACGHMPTSACLLGPSSHGRDDRSPNAGDEFSAISFDYREMSPRTAGDGTESVSTSAAATDPSAEAARLRAELESTKAKLEKREQRDQRGGVTRRVTVGVLVVLFSILVPVTALSGW